MDKKYYAYYRSNQLEHHGIKGQKWGTRRYQNPDGTLTAEGRERYGTKASKKILGVVPTAESRGRYWGNKLKGNSGAVAALSAVKGYSGSRGFFRTRTGAQRKAQFVKGLQEASTGKKMSSDQYRTLQNRMNQSHRRQMKIDLVGGAITTALSYGGQAAVLGGWATGNPVLTGAGYALTGAGVASNVATNVVGLVNRGGNAINTATKTKPKSDKKKKR